MAVVALGGGGHNPKVLHRANITSGHHAIVSLAYASFTAGEQNAVPQLLVASRDNSVRLLGLGSFQRDRLAPAVSRLASLGKPWTSYHHFSIDLHLPMPRRRCNAPAVFCPLLSMERSGITLSKGVQRGAMRTGRP